MLDLAALSVLVTADLAPHRPAVEVPPKKEAAWTAVVGAPAAQKGGRLIWTDDGKGIWTAVVSPDGKTVKSQRSDDCGKTWSKAVTIPKPPEELHGDGGVLYARKKEGLVESRDQGKTWTAVKLPWGEPADLVTTPSGARWAIARNFEEEPGNEKDHEDLREWDAKLFHSTKPGAAWEDVSTYGRRLPKRIAAIGEDVVLGLERQDFMELQMYRFLATREDLPDGGAMVEDSPDRASPMKMWGAGPYLVQTYVSGSAVSVSKDLGKTWTTMELGDLPASMIANEDDPSWLNVADVEAAGDSLWVSTEAGLRVSKDGGKSWSAYGEASDIRNFEVCGKVLITTRVKDSRTSFVQLPLP